MSGSAVAAGSGLEIARRIRAGDRRAEAALAGRFGRPVFFMCLARTRDEGVARDLARKVLDDAIDAIRHARLDDERCLTTLVHDTVRDLLDASPRVEERVTATAGPTCERVRSEGIAGKYLLEPMEESERSAFELHFLECAGCLEELEMAHALHGHLAGERARRALPDSTAVGLPPVERGPGAWGLRIIYIVAAAVALLIVLEVVLSRGDTTKEEAAPDRVYAASAIRTAGPATDPLVVLAPGGGEVFAREAADVRWSVVPTAIAYRVTLTSASGEVAWEARVEEPVARIPADVRLAPDSEYFVRVEAQLRGGGSLTSPIVAIRTGGAQGDSSQGSR